MSHRPLLLLPFLVSAACITPRDKTETPTRTEDRVEPYRLSFTEPDAFANHQDRIGVRIFAQESGEPRRLSAPVEKTEQP